jgi:hypothetical protein
LLLCIGSSYSFILEGNLTEEGLQTQEQRIIGYSKYIYDYSKKRLNSLITKEEFVRFFKEQLLATGNNTVNSIFRKITADPNLEKDKDVDGEGDGAAGEGKGNDGEGKESRSSSPAKNDRSPSLQKGKSKK